MILTKGELDQLQQFDVIPQPGCSVSHQGSTAASILAYRQPQAFGKQSYLPHPCLDPGCNLRFSEVLMLGVKIIHVQSSTLLGGGVQSSCQSLPAGLPSVVRSAHVTLPPLKSCMSSIHINVGWESLSKMLIHLVKQIHSKALLLQYQTKRQQA